MRDVVLVNGATEKRQRSSENVTVLTCGCAYSDQPYRWIQLCTSDEPESETSPRHYDEDVALHERAAEEHRLAELAKEFT